MFLKVVKSLNTEVFSKRLFLKSLFLILLSLFAFACKGEPVSKNSQKGSSATDESQQPYIPVEGISFDSENIRVELGKSHSLQANVYPENATVKNITYLSSNPEVVSIDKSGNLTTYMTGEVVISVISADGGFEKKCKVECYADALEFMSQSEFSVAFKDAGEKRWEGSLFYSTTYAEDDWHEWDGSAISSAKKELYTSSVYPELKLELNLLYIRGKDNTTMNLVSTYDDKGLILEGESSIYCSGDIRVLLDYEDVENTTMSDKCFYKLFMDNSLLVSAPKLPSSQLSEKCYSYMFSGCTSLASAPALPAANLAASCYYNMFSGCTSLASAPALPATNLADGCYSSMFKDCTSLVSAPVLPATTLFAASYSQMFYGCTSLASAPALPATNLAAHCYFSMFKDCTSLASAPALPATTLADWCYYNMFYGCTSLASAPALPATTLAASCYYSMFLLCSSLKFSSTNDIENGYVNEYRLGNGNSEWFGEMFSRTGGTFQGAPNSGQTLWTSNEIIYPDT